MEPGTAIIVIVIVILSLWYGFFKPVETLAHMADDEIQVMAASRKAENITELSNLEISDEAITSAKANLTKLSSIKL